MAAGIAVTGLWLVQEPTPVADGAVLVLQNVDANVAGNGLDLVQQEVVDAAGQLSTHGGGSLTVLVAAGGPAQVAATADLGVVREGQPEHDDLLREQAVADRIGEAWSQARAAQPTEPGRNLLALLIAAADRLPPAGRPVDVFYVGFGLGTVDPADARVQMAGDPGQAVAALAPRLPRLPGARLHVLFPAAVEPQPALNPATAAWRKQFWTQLAEAMQATLVEVREDNVAGDQTPGAPPAPVIDNFDDPTPVPDPADRATTEPAPVVLGGALFLPDRAELVDPPGAEEALRPLAQAWAARPGSYAEAECVGRTAAIGPAASARELSERRAAVAATILGRLGVGRVSARGVGFDQPLPEYPPTDAHQRSVTCRLVPAS